MPWLAARAPAVGGVVTVSPLPSTRVIHPRFEAHHTPVATGTMTGEVQVTRVDNVGTRSAVTGKTEYADPVVIYTGPARIQETAADGVQSATIGDRNATRVSYLITIMRSAGVVLARDVVTVRNPKLGLNEVSFVVRNATRGTLLWETDLRCDLLIPTNAGSGPS